MGTSKSNNYEPEKYIKGGIISFEGKNLKKITEQIEKCSCIIECDEGKGTGFFCLIPFPNKKNLLPVLMTNNHVLSEKNLIKGNKIYIKMNNKKFYILIDSRKVYTNEQYDITIIEIKKNENEELNVNSFLEIDDSIQSNYGYDYFKEKSIYLIHYPKSNNLAEFAVGKIINISLDTDTIQHNCHTEKGSSGCPILDLETNKIVGIHKGYDKNKNKNVGTLIKIPLKNFCEKYKDVIREENKNIFPNSENNEKKININSNNLNNIQMNNDKAYENILDNESRLFNEENNDNNIDNNVNNLNNNLTKSRINNELKENKINEISNNKNDFGSNNNIPKENNYNIIDEITIRYIRNRSNPTDYIYNFKNDLNEDVSADKLFGETFVKNNRYLCKIIIGNEEYELKSYLNNENDEVNKNQFKIKLKGVSKIKDLSCMFCGCLSLDSIEGFEKINTENIISFRYLFSFCKISFIPDISNWDTKNVEYMDHMFFHCFNLKLLPDISKWNTSKLRSVEFMFSDCFSLELLPDFSNWNTNNLEYIDNIFSGCKKLKLIPDISNWKTNKIRSMKMLFFQCDALVEIPDISKWDTSNVIDMSGIFDLCKSLEFLPDISKWNTSKVKSMRKLFSYCESLTFLPDISKWNTFNVEDMSYMFFRCSNLFELPDISKWNINNVKDKTCIFFGCNSNLNIPNKFKTSLVENISGMLKKNPFS